MWLRILDLFGWFDLDNIVWRLKYNGGYISHYKGLDRQNSNEWKVVDNNSGVMDNEVELLTLVYTIYFYYIDIYVKNYHWFGFLLFSAVQDNCEIEDAGGKLENSDSH